MRSVCLFSALILALQGSGLSDDWASWRGPEHSGVSHETGLVETWDPSGKNLLWESPIGGRAAPIVIDGRVYLNCRTNHDVALGSPELIHAQEQVVCRDAATGEVIWDDKFNVFQTDIPAPRVGWASMVGDPETQNVYMHSVSGLFRCYDRDGKVLWERSLFEDYGKISGYGGRTQTPLIDEDRIIVGFFGLNWGKTGAPPPKMTYHAFDKSNGELLWTSQVGGPPLDTNYSNPVITVVDGQRLLVGGGADGGVHAINARTGEYAWSFNMSKRGLNATPAVDGHLVYISHGEDNIDTLEFGRIQCIDARGKGDITESNSVWRKDGIKAGYTGLIVHEGVLYVVADTGKLHAFDSKTGEELWEYSLGTVGKGSPVIADGKMYVMEVNGNIHILKVSREKCESLSKVTLTAADGNGLDEIYGTPAVSDGRVFFVTRDRTIAIGNENAGKRTQHEITPLKESDAGSEVASIQIRPYEARVFKGGEQEYTILGFDKNGRLIGEVDAEISVAEGVKGVKIDGKKLTVAEDAPEQGFELTAKSGELTSVARMRTFPPMPWKWDFEGYKGKQVPPTWINAFLKLQPSEVDGTTALIKGVGKGKPSANMWIGFPEQKGYTVQADVLMREEKRKLPSIGLTAHRYNLILKGNTGKVQVQSWAPHLRMAKEVKFRSDPDKWYTMKVTVGIKDDGAHIYGKVWERGTDEPEEWTIEAVDPHANLNGAPGLYTYSLAECYFDNVMVTE
ncbi:PQQ-like beta-propeller repeat protein [Fuerstiella marisgermanici]|uniref:Outer membrane protein assembly factor BamB n=1 Tax=Fuerstiella marisgermanici TaxID=1891926 RepID=A0A1P8WRW4_9PLAN|nr:PQQ-like beta-propeller repeat protein [Fuerstiella marisgermanici]APZ96795.1 Outer membrane protein assembly factor BamB precursor [Fuerstiella marisgermanici]